MSLRRLTVGRGRNRRASDLPEPQTPITARLSTDETDTASSYTGSSGSFSESSSDRTESVTSSQFAAIPHLISDHETHVLRRREARARLGNALQYLAEEIMLHIQVAYTLLGRLLVYLWGRLQEKLLMAWDDILMLWDDVLMGLKSLLMAWQKLSLMALLIFIPLYILLWTLLHGYKGMTMYVCRNPTAPQNIDLAADLCHHPNITTDINAEDFEFEKLLKTATVVVDAVDALTKIETLTPNPGEALLPELYALSRYFEQFSSELPSHPWAQNVGWHLRIKGNFMTGFVVGFRNSFNHRQDHMPYVIQLRAKDAGSVRDHSTSERYMSEAAYLLRPATFLDSPTVRWLNTLMEQCEFFWAHTHNAKIAEDADAVLGNHTAIVNELMPQARELVKQNMPKWTKDCKYPETTEVDMYRTYNYIDKCYASPALLLENLERALDNFNHQVELARTGQYHHVVALTGLYELQKDLTSLIDQATRPKLPWPLMKLRLLFRGWGIFKDPPPVSAMTARSVLYRFPGWFAQQEERLMRKKKYES